MFVLHTSDGPGGEIVIGLDKADGSIAYLKGGVVQTWADTRARNLASGIDQAVAQLMGRGVRRVLVLGLAGGMASSMLYRLGVEVVSVDSDPRAPKLAQTFFRAPPDLEVVIDDAADFVMRAPPAAFDGVLVDFQDNADTPAAYLSPAFWRSLARATRHGGLIVLNVVHDLHAGPDWSRVQHALDAGIDDLATLDDLAVGEGRLLLATLT